MNTQEQFVFRSGFIVVVRLKFYVTSLAWVVRLGYLRVVGVIEFLLKAVHALDFGRVITLV